MAASRRTGLAVVAVVIAACGIPVEPVSIPGDGVLDCDEGQVHRDAGITVSGRTEQEVVAAALEEWTGADAELLEVPADQLWTAVNDGRDVAIAYPELTGDGTWVVHDVRICGEPDVGPAAIDGELDCANPDTSWVVQASIDQTIPGNPSAEGAIREVLEHYRERHGGDVVFIDEDTGSLVVGDREQVVVPFAMAIPAGGWAVVSVFGCEGYEP